jgi:hypothetical protein
MYVISIPTENSLVSLSMSTDRSFDYPSCQLPATRNALCYAGKRYEIITSIKTTQSSRFYLVVISLALVCVVRIINRDRRLV